MREMPLQNNVKVISWHGFVLRNWEKIDCSEVTERRSCNYISQLDNWEKIDCSEVTERICCNYTSQLDLCFTQDKKGVVIPVYILGDTILIMG